jgi:uncharacterized tannase-like protein DUF6351
MRFWHSARPRRGFTAAAALVTVVIALAAGGTRETAHALSPVTIEVLSNRADLISSGDALVRISPPGDVQVALNGADVSSAFAIRPNGQLEGLVGGLAVGPNTLTATTADGTAASITITNHPKGGPVFAGPQVQPWPCTTENHGLGPAQDSHCNAPTRYSYRYKSSLTGQFGPYDPGNPPADVATTTNDRGETVPYVVRVERGTMDRGIYDVAVLYDPTQPWSAWAPQAGWNHKLYIPFGPSCAPRYRQEPPEDVMSDLALSRGFAVAVNGLNTLGQNCNPVVSAEALMMLKEHVAETYGSIRYTLSDGCSGGSIQQHVIAAGYPGLLDGIMPSCSYPDVATTGNEVIDCKLLLHYFNDTSPQLWGAQAQRAAVEGSQTGATCHAWVNVFRFDQSANPSQRGNTFTDCAVPAEQQYDAATNPQGVRCTVTDYQVAIWGRRPQDGFAKRPLDNVGIQYGLNALNSGLITAEQFVDLNEKIGGVDIDLRFQADRSVADPGSPATAYRASQVTNGRYLAKVPIIDLRGTSNNEIHTDYHSWELRARLDRDAGGHANQVIWTNAGGLAGDPAATRDAFLLMDRWLAAIEADTSARSLEAKVVRNKPADAVDACWIAGRKVTDMSTCRTAFPYYGAPRIAAGAPLTNDVMKCRLKPLERADYSTTFTDEQWARLEAAFPGGVCDWNRRSVGYQRGLPWMTFAGGPGGEPLGPPPSSQPLS